MSGGFQQSSSSSHPQMTPTQLLQTYNQYLPETLATTTGQAAPVATTLASAASEANPIYTQSGLQQLGYAPGYQQMGGLLSQLQGLSTEQLLGGTGGASAMEAAGLNQLLNPVQAASNTQAQNLLGSINLTGLSPGEYNATERALNQTNAGTGNLGLMNNTNAISNAMNFGGAFNNKLGLLGNALGAAGGVSANQQTQVNPVGTALNSGNTSGNFGLGTFAPNQANANITAPLTFGSNTLGSLSSLAGSQKSSSQSTGVQGGLCCFIFLEATNGIMPWWVRECRDEYYKKQPVIALGYRRMAKWLVPMMRYIPGIKSFVNTVMVTPITKYGGWLKGVKGYEDCRKYEPFKRFWFTVWKLIGKV